MEQNTQCITQDALSECEVLVMKVIWQNSEAMSIQEITSRINQRYGKDWKVQTVSTFLSRAVKKGYLEMRRKGRTFLLLSDGGAGGIWEARDHQVC